VTNSQHKTKICDTLVARENVAQPLEWEAHSYPRTGKYRIRRAIFCLERFLLDNVHFFKVGTLYLVKKVAHSWRCESVECVSLKKKDKVRMHDGASVFLADARIDSAFLADAGLGGWPAGSGADLGLPLACVCCAAGAQPKNKPTPMRYWRNKGGKLYQVTREEWLSGEEWRAW
jgi:hypothetical protein